MDAESQTGAQGITPLYAASAAGQSEVVKLLLESGGDANSRGGSFYYGSAVHAAARWRHWDIVYLLIGKGADVRKSGGCALQGGIDKFGTVLHAACREDDLERVTMLLDHGANVNIQHEDQLYGTPLQTASYWGHAGVVRLLIEKGADVNDKGGKYGTALHTASHTGRAEIVKLLLENGADVNSLGESSCCPSRGIIEMHSKLQNPSARLGHTEASPASCTYNYMEF
ncbi:ankyrin repeat-containing domain protein [Mycena vulgaris]|nr:ankyrin repeat-containing domain protein [Mycena vulgaris]